MLEVVQQRVRDRGVVGGGNVPGRDCGDPDAERDSRTAERAERRMEPGAAARRSRTAATGSTKASSGPRTASSRSAGPASPISTCWSMCAAERPCLGDAVERRDERQHDEREPRREQHRPARAGAVGAAAPAQPQEAAHVEDGRQRRAREHEGRRIPARSSESLAVAAKALHAVHRAVGRGEQLVLALVRASRRWRRRRCWRRPRS